MRGFVFSVLMLGIMALNGAAFAQAVDSAPLGPAPYTLNKETDPMATGSSEAVPEPVSKGPAIVAPPPPGADDQPGASRDAGVTENVAPVTVPPPPVSSGVTVAPSRTVGSYPNNEVSGVPVQDEKKFENRVYCSLKVDFGSYARGPNKKTGEVMRSYLDAQGDRLRYTKEQWGKEGEYSYCVVVAEHKDQASIYKALKKIVSQADNSAPVSMIGKGFAPVSNKAYVKER